MLLVMVLLYNVVAASGDDRLGNSIVNLFGIKKLRRDASLKCRRLARTCGKR